MKKVTWALFAIALIGVFSAFTKQSSTNLAVKKYVGVDVQSSRYYIAPDPNSATSPFEIPLTDQQGEDYNCEEGEICTFTADDANLKFDNARQLWYVDAGDESNVEPGLYEPINP